MSQSSPSATPLQNYSKEGRYGIFIVNLKMDIRSVCKNRSEYEKLQRYSLLRLLAWMQRTVFLDPHSHNIRSFFEGSPMLSDVIHDKLLRYYMNCRVLNIADETPIIPEDIRRKSPYSTNNLCSSIITTISKPLFSFFVTVWTDKGEALIPLECLSDL